MLINLVPLHIADLLAKVDPSLFQDKFGCGLEAAHSLVSSLSRQNYTECHK